jgi:hypothetical protein
MPARPKKRSEYALMREIAERLARAGIQPYAGDQPEYLVLHGEREGEVIDFGLPLRSHRMFPTRTRSRADRIATEFAAFAAERDQTNWRVWTIHRPTKKTKLKALVRDLKAFNSLINRIFTLLRKVYEFELLLLGIHIEFDHSTQLFDIHAHFVCAMPEKLREDVRIILMTAFSRADVSDKPLRNPYLRARILRAAVDRFTIPRGDLRKDA